MQSKNINRRYKKNKKKQKQISTQELFQIFYSQLISKNTISYLFYMKNSKIIKPYMDTNLDPEIFDQQSELSKPHSLFQEESPSYRTKSIDHKVIELNDELITTAVKEKEYHKAISLLHDLEVYINNQDNETTRTKKLLSFYELSICYYNHAVVYQKVNNDQQSARYFQKSLKNLQCMQGYITSREEGVSYSIQVSKLQIQYCSILSQTGKHQQAITYGEKALLKLIECFRILQAICCEFNIQNRLPQTTTNSINSRNSSELVNFKKHVILEADKVLKQMIKLPEPHQLITKFKKRYESLMQKMFFWKTNSENNEKLLRKQLYVERKLFNSDRNMLGVKKNSFFNENLTLQSLTNLEVKSINYVFSNDPFFLLSAPKLIEMAFFVSMIYFMIATQIRFSQGDLNVNKLKIEEKYKKLSSDQRMLKCKMIHMKAIEIAGKFLPEKNQFFTHILNRFNKNYKCIMQEINEESIQQTMKQIQSNKKKSLKEEGRESDYGLSSYLKIQESSIRVKNRNSSQSKDNHTMSLAALKMKKTKKNQSPHHLRQLSKNSSKITMSQEKNGYHLFQKHKRSHSHEETSKKKKRSNIKLARSAVSQEGRRDQRQRLKTVGQANKAHQKLLKKLTERSGRSEIRSNQSQSLIKQTKYKTQRVPLKKQKQGCVIRIASPSKKRKFSSYKLNLKAIQKIHDHYSEEKSERKFNFQRKIPRN